MLLESRQIWHMCEMARLSSASETPSHLHHPAMNLLLEPRVITGSGNLCGTISVLGASSTFPLMHMSTLQEKHFHPCFSELESE